MEFDDSGRVFFDRSPENFPQILTYLRDETLPREECALHVYHEAKFYRVQGLMDWCSRQVSLPPMIHCYVNGCGDDGGGGGSVCVCLCVCGGGGGGRGNCSWIPGRIPCTLSSPTH